MGCAPCYNGHYSTLLLPVNQKLFDCFDLATAVQEFN
jgi:hypothetical protein